MRYNHQKEQEKMRSAFSGTKNANGLSGVAESDIDSTLTGAVSGAGTGLAAWNILSGIMGIEGAQKSAPQAGAAIGGGAVAGLIGGGPLGAAVGAVYGGVSGLGYDSFYGIVKS